MYVQGRLSTGERSLLYLAAAAVLWLLFPPSAQAIEVGCFCTFVFVSSMFCISIGITVLSKRAIAKRVWALSLGRISLITFLEVILLVVVLFFIQTQFFIRILAFLPMAFLLNYVLTTSPDPSLQPAQVTKKRMAMAAISSLVLPLTVQIMGFIATYLSAMITFKEVRV